MWTIQILQTFHDLPLKEINFLDIVKKRKLTGTIFHENSKNIALHFTVLHIIMLITDRDI